MVEAAPGVSRLASELRGGEGRKPWGAICLALVLLIVGSSLLISGCVQYFTVAKHGHWLAMGILGALMFIPGFYHTRIAYMAWKGYQGYSFSQLNVPSFV